MFSATVSEILESGEVEYLCPMCDQLHKVQYRPMSSGFSFDRCSGEGIRIKLVKED